MDMQPIVSKLRSTVVPHPNFVLTHDRLFNLSAIAQPGSVIVVVGPTRVGKTYLSHELIKNLVDPKKQNGSSTVPIARIEASTTDNGFISTRYILLQFLRAIRHPFYVDGGPIVRMRDTESTLRRQTVAGLSARGTEYLIVDEAHHLLRTKSTRSAEGVLDSVKCLGNETGCIVIVIGGYELLKYLFHSAHLNGRMTVLEFSNYGVDADDLREFDRLLVTLDEWLPWARGFSLYHFRDHIYEGSLGCYGQLVHWSLSALAEMQSQNCQRLKLRHFLATRRLEQVQTIKNDIELGKSLLADFTLKRDKHEQAAVPVQSPIRRGKPFHRRPARDPVGVRGQPHG